jgi:hypothetical protein
MSMACQTSNRFPARRPRIQPSAGIAPPAPALAHRAPGDLFTSATPEGHSTCPIRDGTPDVTPSRGGSRSRGVAGAGFTGG